MTPYDYGSVMHYGSTAFALNRNEPTIIPTQNTSAFIGQRIELSPIDILEIQRYYSCVPTSSTQNDITNTSTTTQTTTTSARTTTTDAASTTKNMTTAITSVLTTKMNSTTTPFNERTTITTTVDGVITLGSIRNAFQPSYIVCWISVVSLWNIFI